MVADPVFLDTNVLIYLVWPESTFHVAAVENLRTLEEAARAMWISMRSLGETRELLRRDVRALPSF
jgi:predicted nucleic acid-binding protein